MTGFADEDLDSLAAKLDGLDLTDGERAALDAVLDAAMGSDAEVSGFALGHQHQNPLRLRLGLILQFDEADSLFGRRTEDSYIGETEKHRP